MCQTRSSCSRLPNRPHGRIASTISSTTKRHHVREQRIDVLDGGDLGHRDDERADHRAEQTVEAADQRRRKRLQPDGRHRASTPELSASNMPASEAVKVESPQAKA